MLRSASSLINSLGLICLLLSLFQSTATSVRAESPTLEQPIATFSIVARDPVSGELGVAVASRFFGVGVVVPWAKAGVGAVATQAYANTTFGWRGLDMLQSGMTPEMIRDSLVATDSGSAQRQFGIVSTDGNSVTFTGDKCLDWAGGRSGDNYACQGNILAGEAVVIALEKTFLSTEGSLADRLYAALLAGEAAGGDSRGKQSAALLVVKEEAGYGGFTDRAIDIRVDDHAEPFKELGRILNIGQMSYSWNEAWTLFTKEKHTEALPYMERAVELAPDMGGTWYDLAVIRLAAGVEGAMEALRKAIELNPKLKTQALTDDDLNGLRDNAEFKTLVE